MAAPVRTPRSTWLEAGLRVLAAGGPDAVRIEPLAESLGVTRGGFYWHFESRPAFLGELLDAWEEQSVSDVIDRVAHGAVDARARLRHLFSLAAERPQLLAVDLAVRDWSRRDRAVAERLRRVDNRRMDFLRAQFAEFCDDDAEVEARAMLVVSLWVGSHFVASDHGKRSRGEVVELATRHLLR